MPNGQGQPYTGLSRTDVTSDGHVINRSSYVVVDENGVVHYSVICEKIPDHVVQHLTNALIEVPFVMAMCDLLDSYDKATSWRDFVYPERRFSVEEEHEGVPTCFRCSSA